jgi:hypothetical protein
VDPLRERDAIGMRRRIAKNELGRRLVHFQQVQQEALPVWRQLIKLLTYRRH